MSGQGPEESQPQSPPDSAFQSFIDDLQSGSLSYEDAKKRYLELGDTIRERYEREVTAVCIDVVSSREAKTHGTPLDAQLTFEAYYRWIEEKLRDYGCAEGAYHWAGDGLLAIFVRPEQAVGMARAVVDGLDTFNSHYNRLKASPIAIRAGIHTGPVLHTEGGLAQTLGKLASDTLDFAGHLQKSASPNQISISSTTYSKLNEGKGHFVPVRRRLPDAGTCYAYPPTSVSSDMVGATPPATDTPAPPPRAANNSMIAWGIGIATLVVAMSVAVVMMVLPRLQNKPGGGASGPVILNPQPVAGAQNGNGAVNPGNVTTPTPAQPGSTITPPVASGPPPVLAAGGPSRQLWRSPEANSGVPPRLVASPPEFRWLLSIGVGHYRDSQLGTSAAGGDARNASDLLARMFQVPANHAQTIVDEGATMEGVRQAFSNVQRSAGSGRDTVIIYLAGNATLAPDRSDFRHSNGTGYAFFTFDGNSADPQNTAIYGADLSAWLSAIRAQTIIVLVDTPFAGALDLPAGTDAGRQLVLLAASGGAQRSALTRGQQGAAFLESLMAGAQGAANTNGDRRITLPEVTQFVQADLSRRTNGAQTATVRTAFGGFVPELDIAP